MKKIKHKSKKKKSLAKKIISILLVLILISFISILVAGCYIYSKIENDLTESIDKGNKIIATMSDSDFKSRTSTNIYDKNGKLIKELKIVD